MSGRASNRPPLSPKEAWLSDDRQVLHFRPSRWDRWSQQLEVTVGELLPGQPVPLLKRRLELRRPSSSGPTNARRVGRRPRRSGSCRCFRILKLIENSIPGRIKQQSVERFTAEMRQIRCQLLHLPHLICKSPDLTFMCDFPALQIDSLDLAANVDIANKIAILRVPESFIVGSLTQCISATAGGRVKSTSYQRIDIDIKAIDFINGGLLAVAHLRAQFRELLFKNPITGSCHWSPWVSVSGDALAKFNVALINETLCLTTRDVDLKLEGPLAELGDFVVDLFHGEDKVKGKIQHELNSLNGLNAIQLFKKYAPGNLKDKLATLGLSDAQIQSIFDRIQVDVTFTDIEMNLTGRW